MVDFKKLLEKNRAERLAKPVTQKMMVDIVVRLKEVTSIHQARIILMEEAGATKLANVSPEKYKAVYDAALAMLNEAGITYP